MSHRTLTPLPLLHNDDSYIIYLEEVGLKCVRILQIHRFPNNENGEGVEEHYYDLDPDSRRAVIRQINRRHVGKTVMPK